MCQRVMGHDHAQATLAQRIPITPAVWADPTQPNRVVMPAVLLGVGNTGAGDGASEAAPPAEAEAAPSAETPAEAPVEATTESGGGSNG